MFTFGFVQGVSLAMPIFFPRIDDSHCDRIRYSLTDVHCFDDGNVGKQPVVWEEYCAEYRLKELGESMDRCTNGNRRDVTFFFFFLNDVKQLTINQSKYREFNPTPFA